MTNNSQQFWTKWMNRFNLSKWPNVYFFTSVFNISIIVLELYCMLQNFGNAEPSYSFSFFHYCWGRREECQNILADLTQLWKKKSSILFCHISSHLITFLSTISSGISNGNFKGFQLQTTFTLGEESRWSEMNNFSKSCMKIFILCNWCIVFSLRFNKFTP